MDIDLSRYISGYQRDYKTALNEVKRGRKTTHWMWYIFPQIHGLGRSQLSQFYAIKSLDEAKAFLDEPYLASNLTEICQALLQLDCDNATTIFGKPDDMKLRSSMTLFAIVSGENSVFHKVLQKFFDGKYDEQTLKILNIEV